MELPADLVTEILVKLPVKSLFRLKCVSKSWQELISDSGFVRKQLHHAKQQAVRNGGRESFIIYSSEAHHRTFETMVISGETPPDQAVVPTGGGPGPVLSSSTFCRVEFAPASSATLVEVTGHCDGMLCVRAWRENHTASSIYLWNPSIRYLKKVPSWPEKNSDYNHKFSLLGQAYTCGIGHNPKAGDYYICKFPIGGSTPKIPDGAEEFYQNEVQILYLKSNSWRKISSSYTRRLNGGSAMCVNGNLYLLSTCGPSEQEPVIINFDAGNENFQEIALPAPRQEEEDLEDALRSYWTNGRLNVFNDNLCLIKQSREKFLIWEYEETTSTWIKVGNISTYSCLGGLPMKSLFRTRNHMFFSSTYCYYHEFEDSNNNLETMRMKFFKYSLQTKEITEESPFRGSTIDYSSKKILHVYPFYETLVCPFM